MPVEAPVPPVTTPAPTISQPQRAAQTTVNVSGIPTGDPLPPAKPGSARSRMEAEFSKKFGGETDSPASPDTAAATKADFPKSPTAVKPPGGEGKPEAGESTNPDAPASTPADKPLAPATAPDAGKKKGESPWKLVDQHKAARVQAEQQILTLRKQMEDLQKQITPKEKIEDYEKRIKEMSEDLRYHNAEKYDPEIIKANHDYEAAWTRASRELPEISVKDPATGDVRTATVGDLAAIVRMPLGQAREVAEQVFGPFANDMMEYRREIKALWDSKDAKLEELKKNGAQRDEQRQQQMSKTEQEMNDYVGRVYSKTVEEDMANERHGHLFKPREGDEGWNKALEDGYKLVDEAMSTSPKSPNLTAEQRVQIIRKHAAVRNMAGSWKALRYELDTTKKSLEEAREKLKSYEDTEPPAGGRAAAPPAERKRGMAGLNEDLAKLAH